MNPPNKKFLKIANITEEGKVGGPQVVMVRMATALSGRGETTIIMPRENAGPFQSLCQAHDLTYIALPISRITKEWRVALRYVFLFPYEIFRIRRVLKKGGFDLVQVSGGSWQYKGVIAAKLAGIPSVWTLNDTQMPSWIRRLFKLFSPLATGFIFDSHRSQNYYGAVLAQRLQGVISSTVDTDFFDPTNQYAGDEEIIAQLGNAPVIGTVANVNPIKGLETLIRAAAALRAEVPKLRVVVVGALPERQKAYHQQLVALAESLGLGDAIIWAGRRSDVRPLLVRFDVYVCSSLAESSPVSVWEAMALARPVVSTDVGDVGRHVHDGKSGYVVPVKDHTSMAARLKDVLADPETARAFGKTAREEVKACFSPLRIADKTATLYTRIIEATSNRT